jgi:DNA-binding beta-propeller fold protein YncE
MNVRLHAFACALAGLGACSALASLTGCTKSAPAGSGQGANAIAIAPAVHSPEQVVAPFDATPDPLGKTVYLTALTPDGVPAVFRSTAAGQGLTKLYEGAPLVSPYGISIDDDGQTLFIADMGALADGGMGAVFTMSIGGGVPAVLKGSEGTLPRGIEVSGAKVYVSGTSGGDPAVFAIPTTGGAATALATGMPLHDPSGIAVDAQGQVYVIDTAASASGRGTVFKIAAGAVTKIASEIAVGYPAGIALGDDKTLFVSALHPTKKTDVVYIVDVASGGIKSFTKTVGQFSDSAGLHRARKAPVFAWCDRWAGNAGTIYVLQ